MQEKKRTSDSLYSLNFELRSSVYELKQREETINKMNEQLEQKVHTRTQELQQSLENLQQAQNRIVETEKMASLGSLVAGVAHEINTPVGTSITAITSIESETKDILKSLENNNLSKSSLIDYLEMVKDMSKAMHMSLGNAANLVRSFKQVATDQHEEEKRNFNLYLYVNDVLLSLHNQLKHTKIEVLNKIDPQLNIMSYAGIYSQIISNFIQNSLNHAFDKNLQHKSKPQIIIKAYIESKTFHLIYEDNGRGMDEATIKQIFEPFFYYQTRSGGQWFRAKYNI